MVLETVRPLRLGVNIDHVATLRNARGGRDPDPLRAAQMAIDAGADGITAHLREDRRHIVDADIARLAHEIARPLNLEMAATDEMVAIALRTAPHAVCLVPENRAERTTEGGLDVVGGEARLAVPVGLMRDSGIRVSLFVEPDPRQLDVARKLGAAVVELHTGRYCDLVAAGDGEAAEAELRRLTEAAAYGEEIGLEVHAGHGISFETVAAIAAVPQVVELNIGHFLVGEAVFVGLATAIGEMRARMDAARAEAAAGERP
ncbi:pyridoxine 5'-phosphate synthase [Amorphus sp. 3PC139-8]|uniref:pyridoxine 5'-phosphate synthase n=1 Tax=Amorphus sp. 3PC139-8 TaxID=2735676 RepID=UPI00345D2319